MNLIKSLNLDFTSLTDSYNASHYLMYPPKTTEVSGYIEARSNSIFPNISFFGLQYYLKEYLQNISKNLRNTDLDLVESRWNAHGLPFNKEGWEIIVDDYDGYLPLEIQGVPEGSWIPRGNVLVQCRNTDPRLFWLPTWVETSLVQNTWFGSTVATISKECKINIYNHLVETGCESIDQVLPWTVHDFGLRGVSSFESGCLGGTAHLTNFSGSDTYPANDFIRTYYGMKDMPSGSIPASNHAVITSWGGPAFEPQAFQNILNTFLKDGKVVACVSDSYDLWNAIDMWGTKFKDQIVNSGGRLVIRPDSGNPVEIVPKAIKELMLHFGYTVNKKGYMVLPNCVRVIWGDGIDPEYIDAVLRAMSLRGLAAENVVFGMGGALLQLVNRDMGSFAFKVNEVVVDGKRRPVFKNPATGQDKSSKPGRQALMKLNGEYVTVPESILGNNKNYLEDVYRDGDILIEYSFQEIRERAMEGIC